MNHSCIRFLARNKNAGFGGRKNAGIRKISGRKCRKKFRIFALIGSTGCGQNYIGQTKRNLITCLNEHRMREDSEVCKHLLNNPNHEINYDSPKTLDRSNQVTKLRIKETLHISKTEPQLNAENRSLPLYLFNA